MSKMTIRRAKAIVADLASQDVANEEGDDYSHHGSGRLACDQWRRAAAQAGDEGVIEAIDTLGSLVAGEVYESARARLA